MKSSAAFNRNTPGNTKVLLADLPGIRLENKHEVYLGLPDAAFRSKRALFASLKDRIWKRIHGRHEKTLSLAGKATLIQLVVQAIPSYAMSCFRLPKTLLKEFQSLSADFFRHDGDRRRIHLITWNKMCTSKLKGGLGFRNLEAFNLALLAKQLWRLITRSECLVSKVLKAKYFPLHHLFEVQLGTWPLFTWRSIIAARDLLKFGSRWRIGSGHSVDVWKDPWIPRKPSFRVIIPNASNVQNLQVSALIRQESREWDLEVLNTLFWPEDREVIQQIPLSSFSEPDFLIWHYSSNGLFSVRSAYHLALSEMSQEGTSCECLELRNLWKTIWQCKVPNKVKIFSWRAILNILPTGGNIKKKLRMVEFGCPFCGSEEETGVHILQQYPFARQIWALSSFFWSILGALISSVEEWFLTLSIKMSSTDFELFLMFVGLCGGRVT
ncbi:UNVERIFIED_CONTAM: hypothetical protein Slati_0515700 [Sesamum latifolium]|uniref:Reverse transcriptase zinc-binding domain-containing protein n=1 Tax=Sesamum latifolium TaxID=2727402 RepID=A0AAW2XYX4_9LAMI